MPCATLRFRRDDERGDGVVVVQRSDLGELEEALGVGTRFTGEPGERRQACARDEQRQAEL